MLLLAQVYSCGSPVAIRYEDISSVFSYLLYIRLLFVIGSGHLKFGDPQQQNPFI